MSDCGSDTNSRDGDFVLAVHPEHPEVLILTGCNGGGMRIAPGIGRLAVELLAGTCDLELRAPQPSRALDSF